MRLKDRQLLEGMKVGQWAPLDMLYDPPEKQFMLRVKHKDYSEQRMFRKDPYTSPGGEVVADGLWRRVELQDKLRSGGMAYGSWFIVGDDE